LSYKSRARWKFELKGKAEKSLPERTRSYSLLGIFHTKSTKRLILWPEQKKLQLETLHKLREAKTTFSLPVVRNASNASSREQQCEIQLACGFLEAHWKQKGAALFFVNVVTAWF